MYDCGNSPESWRRGCRQALPTRELCSCAFLTQHSLLFLRFQIFIYSNCLGAASVTVKSSFLMSYRKGVALQGWIPDSSDTDILIFVLSQQAAASAFSGSSRACNLIFLRKPPLCGLGLVGAPAELCNGILSFCSILECDEILTCPSDYILLHTFEHYKKKKKIELCLGHSLVTLNFPVSLESEGAAVSVVSLPHCSSVSFSHVSLIEAVEVSGRMPTLRAPAGQHRAEQCSSALALSSLRSAFAEFLQNPEFGRLCLLDHMKIGHISF